MFPQKIFRLYDIASGVFLGTKVSVLELQFYEVQIAKHSFV